MSSQQTKTSKTITNLRTEVQDKWDSTGFLTGLEAHTKENMTQLFESQASHLLSPVKESRWDRFKKWFNRVILRKKPELEFPLLPIARRVATQTVGLDLVSVQPMSLPVGQLMMFLDFDLFREDVNFLIDGI